MKMVLESPVELIASHLEEIVDVYIYIYIYIYIHIIYVYIYIHGTERVEEQ